MSNESIEKRLVELRRLFDAADGTAWDLSQRAHAAELFAEIRRLNEWADGMTDAALKERRTGEEYQREIKRERDDARANVEHLRSQRDGLLKAARELVKLLEDVGDATEWRDDDETDRVFAWHEFDELREAIKLAEESPLARAVRIARGNQGPPSEPVSFA